MSETPYSLHSYASFRWQTRNGLDRLPSQDHPYLYAYANPILHTDPSGYDPTYICDSLPSHLQGQCYARREPAIQPTVANTRVYYLNQIGNQRGVIPASADPDDFEGYILFRVQQTVGAKHVIHILVYNPDVGTARGEMFGELAGKREWSSYVATTIHQDIQRRPLKNNERIVVIGNSGGGTLAVNSLKLLESKRIAIDQVILRGSPVNEWTLTNVRRVDYITSNFDPYYSFDVNPFDCVVREHKVDFWEHVVEKPEDKYRVAELIVSLVQAGGKP